jgi:hypothetical protein
MADAMTIAQVRKPAANSSDPVCNIVFAFPFV